MADITDPQLNLFISEVLRPLSSIMVKLNALAEMDDSTWNTAIMPILTPFADDDVIVDPNTVGLTILTKEDAVNFWAQVQAYMAQVDQVGVFDVINKPKANFHPF